MLKNILSCCVQPEKTKEDPVEVENEPTKHHVYDSIDEDKIENDEAYVNPSDFEDKPDSSREIVKSIEDDNNYRALSLEEPSYMDMYPSTGHENPAFEQDPGVEDKGGSTLGMNYESLTSNGILPQHRQDNNQDDSSEFYANFKPEEDGLKGKTERSKQAIPKNSEDSKSKQKRGPETKTRLRTPIEPPVPKSTLETEHSISENSEDKDTGDPYINIIEWTDGIKPSTQGSNQRSNDDKTEFAKNLATLLRNEVKAKQNLSNTEKNQSSKNPTAELKSRAKAKEKGNATENSPSSRKPATLPKPDSSTPQSSTQIIKSKSPAILPKPKVNDKQDSSDQKVNPSGTKNGLAGSLPHGDMLNEVLQARSALKKRDESKQNQASGSTHKKDQQQEKELSPAEKFKLELGLRRNKFRLQADEIYGDFATVEGGLKSPVGDGDSDSWESDTDDEASIQPPCTEQLKPLVVPASAKPTTPKPSCNKDILPNEPSYVNAKKDSVEPPTFPCHMSSDKGIPNTYVNKPEDKNKSHTPVNYVNSPQEKSAVLGSLVSDKNKKGNGAGPTSVEKTETKKINSNDSPQHTDDESDYEDGNVLIENKAHSRDNDTSETQFQHSEEEIYDDSLVINEAIRPTKSERSGVESENNNEATPTMKDEDFESDAEDIYSDNSVLHGIMAAKKSEDLAIMPQNVEEEEIYDDVSVINVQESVGIKPTMQKDEEGGNDTYEEPLVEAVKSEKKPPLPARKTLQPNSSKVVDNQDDGEAFYDDTEQMESTGPVLPQALRAQNQGPVAKKKTKVSNVGKITDKNNNAEEDIYEQVEISRGFVLAKNTCETPKSKSLPGFQKAKKHVNKRVESVKHERRPQPLPKSNAISKSTPDLSKLTKTKFGTAQRKKQEAIGTELKTVLASRLTNERL